MKKYFNKQTFAAFIFGAILFTSISAFAETMNVTKNLFPVLIDGVKATVDAYNIDGYTYLKLGDLKQAGLKVVFNETDKKIEITTAVTEKENNSNPRQETNQPATPTPTAPQPTPVQETAPEPDPEPAPDLTVYNAKLDLLTDTYNQDVKKIKDEAQEKANQISYDFAKKHTEYEKQNAPLGWEMAFNNMQAKIKAIEKERDAQIELRTKAYDIDVLELKQEYGIE